MAITDKEQGVWELDQGYNKINEGGIWNYGRHNRASTFIKDMEKYNNACLLGWNLLRLSTDMVKNGEGVIYILKFFRGDNYIE